MGGYSPLYAFRALRGFMTEAPVRPAVPEGEHLRTAADPELWGHRMEGSTSGARGRSRGVVDDVRLERTMSHPSGTPALVQRLMPLVAVVLVVFAVGLAFGRVFTGHGATFRLLGVGVASALVAWLLRRRGLLLATVVSAALLFLAIGIVVFPRSTWFGAPTPETLRQMADAAARVGEDARIQIAPVSANPSLMAAAIVAVWAATFSCFALAFRAESPLLALLPPLALVAFADSVLQGNVRPAYGILFLIAALVVVFADSLLKIPGWGPIWSPAGSRNRLFPSVGRGARRVGAGVVILAAIAPFVVPGFGSKAEIDLSSIGGGDDRVHVSSLVQLGAILNQGEDVEAFRVRSDHAVYWRMSGLDRFDPNDGWSPSLETGNPVQLQHPLQEVVTGPGTVTIDATFTVESDLAFTTLPIPYQPLELLSSDESASWFPRSQSMSAGDWPDTGTEYRVRSVYPVPTAQVLRSTPFGTESEFPGETQLPSGPEIDEVRQLAKEWTAEEENGFDEVMAIQQRLHTFRYDKTARYEDSLYGLDQFLKVGHGGFCVHFAYAMGVMLRTLGIPARVAIGFTPGRVLSDGVYSVTTHDLHAWVEVPFEGYGWLPFEPTPFGMVNPATTSYIYANPTSGPCQGTVCNGSPSTGPGNHGSSSPPSKNPPSLSASRAPTPTVAPLPERSGPSVLRPLVSAPAILGLILIGVPLARWLRRRRRLARAARDPRGLILATYHMFSERAEDLGLGRGPGETPSEYRSRIEATDRLPGGLLERLTGTVVVAAYSARPVTKDDALDVAADADQVIRELRGSTPFGRRLRAIYGIR